MTKVYGWQSANTDIAAEEPEQKDTASNVTGGHSQGAITQEL